MSWNAGAVREDEMLACLVFVCVRMSSAYFG